MYLTCNSFFFWLVKGLKRYERFFFLFTSRSWFLTVQSKTVHCFSTWQIIIPHWFHSDPAAELRKKAFSCNPAMLRSMTWVKFMWWTPGTLVSKSSRPIWTLLITWPMRVWRGARPRASAWGPAGTASWWSTGGPRWSRRWPSTETQ